VALFGFWYVRWASGMCVLLPFFLFKKHSTSFYVVEGQRRRRFHYLSLPFTPNTYLACIGEATEWKVSAFYVAFFSCKELSSYPLCGGGATEKEVSLSIVAFHSQHLPCMHWRGNGMESFCILRCLLHASDDLRCRTGVTIGAKTGAEQPKQ